jgi:hypothetical protein
MGILPPASRPEIAMRILTAAAFYFAVVFAAGMLLGPIRVLWIEPRIGPTWATLCESPLLAAVMVWAAGWTPHAAGMEITAAFLLLMGIVALAFQQLADLLVGRALRGVTAAQHFAHFATKAGLIYAILLVLFVVMPLIVHSLG